MRKNTNEKSLLEINNSMFGKIKMFFRKLFKSDNIKESVIDENITEQQKKSSTIFEKNFINNVSEKKLSLRLQKMQKDLECGKIIEEDLSECDVQALRNMYLQQIEKKKQSIDKYKNRIVRIRAKLS